MVVVRPRRDARTCCTRYLRVGKSRDEGEEQEGKEPHANVVWHVGLRTNVSLNPDPASRSGRMMGGPFMIPDFIRTVKRAPCAARDQAFVQWG